MDEFESSDLVVLIAAIPFLGAWSVGVAAWFLGVAEYAALYLLRDFLFERGRIALRRQLELPPPASPSLGETTKLDRSQLRFTSPTRALFAPRFRWAAFGWNRSPGPVKGVIAWSGSRAELVVRHPVGPIVFMLAWLAAWAIGSLTVIVVAMGAPDPDPSFASSLIIPVGGLGGYAMYRFLLWYGVKSADTIADEVVAHLES